ncbi:hypothetical protein [Roseinatronobacter bogoriensis]|uniref:hypothetical protein n=1 Tax=Roseinatronobacter bogoriensis TaxID=119542 RepID=UPI001064C1F5|nr:hypothetical protein [Rhodobaca bogoriensis]MBB4207270.1 hypothetical protein [Rhodobaca bogoriensis DSM 18756]TDY65769.1 hypothetical protein EV660_11737 [Rhodobaca bogoriensis DSM 18756]
MTNELTLDQARDMDAAALRAIFDEALSQLDLFLRDACICYLALLDQGAELPLLHPAFRHAEAIATGALSPRVAMRHATNRNIIGAMAGLPLDLQDRLVDGEKVKIAVMSDQGRIHSDEVCLEQMSPEQMRRAFGADGVRDWQVQGELLIKGQSVQSSRAPSKPVIRVDRETRDIIINRVRVSPEDLEPAFAALGLQVKPFMKGRFKPVRIT